MNRLFRKEIQTPSKCKHIQPQRKANDNQKTKLFKETMAHNLQCEAFPYKPEESWIPDFSLV